VPEDISKTTVVLVGPGRVGRAFARSWTASGGGIVIVARDSGRARTFARSLERAEVLGLDKRLRLAGDLVILSVPDDEIRPLAERLSGRVACRFAFHFSGALSSEELAPLSSGGAKLASLHPLRAFTGATEESWQDAFVAVEGEDSAARTAVKVCRQIQARPHRLSAAHKPLYHAAATLAAGGSAALLSLATRLWAAAGLSDEEGRTALADLAVGAVDAVRRLPFEQALTGPVARRDLETVRIHRDALASWPELAAIYAILARETLRQTDGRGGENEIAAILSIESEDSPAGVGATAKQSDNRRRNG
jgi:predicted short-subunit dehydrogenase-like oxidoreductase (DUF2520 family)